MKKSPADNKKDNRFELLRELLLAEDREKFQSLSQEVILSEKLAKNISPLVDEKIEHLREKFPEYFGESQKLLKFKLETHKTKLLKPCTQLWVSWLRRLL